jgi:hypothetical protein
MVGQVVRAQKNCAPTALRASSPLSYILYLISHILYLISYILYLISYILYLISFTSYLFSFISLPPGAKKAKPTEASLRRSTS